MVLVRYRTGRFTMPERSALPSIPPRRRDEPLVRRTRISGFNGRQSVETFVAREGSRVGGWFTGQGRAVRVEVTEASGDTVVYELAEVAE
jgi:hypothetical protein